MNWLRKLSENRLLFKCLEKERHRVFPIGHVEADDIFIASYPKSGNTWFRQLTAACAYGLLPQFSPTPLYGLVVPDTHQEALYVRFAKTMYFKTHALPSPDFRKTVYLLRDGRDVMVSYHHWLQQVYRQEFTLRDMVTKGTGLFPCQWHTHVSAWMENPFQSNLLLIKYEDLLENPVSQLRRFCEFAGLQRDDAFLTLVAESASFHNMEKHNSTVKECLPGVPETHPIRRRGQAGCWREEMPPEIQDLFMAAAGPVMKSCAYA